MKNRSRSAARRRGAGGAVSADASSRRWGHRGGVLSAALALALLAASGWQPDREAQALGPNDRRLTNARTGIAVEAPAGWMLSQHTGYSDTVVLLVHPDGSRISISAAITSARDAQELFNQNRPALIAQRLMPTVVSSGARGALSVDLSGAGRSDRLRQVYLVRAVPSGQQAIVLTLVSGSKAFASRLAALEFVASRLTLEDPLPLSNGNRTLAAGGASGTAATPSASPAKP